MIQRYKKDFINLFPQETEDMDSKIEDLLNYAEPRIDNAKSQKEYSNLE